MAKIQPRIQTANTPVYRICELNVPADRQLWLVSFEKWLSAFKYTECFKNSQSKVLGCHVKKKTFYTAKKHIVGLTLYTLFLELVSDYGRCVRFRSRPPIAVTSHLNTRSSPRRAGPRGASPRRRADADTDVSQGFISKGSVWPIKTTHSSPAVCTLHPK